jgi:thiol-disulfide isomerase/thioredoxin
VISEARLGVDVGLTRRFGVSLMVPVRIVTSAIRYLDLAGNEVELVNANIHHRDETVAGLADPMVLGSAGFAVGDWRLTARAGLTVPIGRTEENPFTLGEMGLAHQHIQMGTGTVNPVVAVEVARSWGPWRAGAFALTQQVVYEGSKGYQAGDRYAGGVVVRRRVGTRWSVRGGVDALGETAEHWDGVVHTDDGNQGRFDLILGAGASWAATEAIGIEVGLKVPVVTHAVGGQLSMPAIVELGASWTFGRPPAPVAEAHEHEHEHEHEAPAEPAEPAEAAARPDTTGLDVVDLGQPGEAVDLVPVPGKVTIFDFWATWCEPCKVLEPALVEIARAHADLVAIRRIDAVDWDSAVVAQHLTPNGFSLPHLKIFDRSGMLVFERSSAEGKLEALIDDVRQLVEQQAAPAPVVPAGPAPASLAEPAAPAPKPRPARRRPRPAPAVRIAVTAAGFVPNNVVVPAGKPVTLRFERTVEKTCATEVVMTVDGKQIVKDLPLHQPVELTLTFAKPGEVTYACAMDMIRGTITVTD